MLTEEEKILRLQGLGGSDIAAAFGISPYRTPFELWEEKALGHISLDDNEDLAFRSYLEPAIGDMYRHRTGYTVRRHEGMTFHPDYPWLFANVDFIAHDGTGKKRILEIKTSRQFKSDKFGDEYTDQIPLEYLLQVANYCMCLDIPSADIAVLFGDFNLKIFEYKRNPALEQNIVMKTRDFWFENVVAKVPPEYTANDNLNKLYNCVSGKVMESDDDLNNKIKNLRELKALQSKALKEIEALQSEIKMYMKDAEYLTHKGDKVIKFSSYTTKKLDTKKLKKEHPKLCEKYINEVACKRFTVLGVKDDE